MNYIAHLHIAQHTGTSLLGNFLGDFVKGNDLSHLPEELQQGIRLHRHIDSFTDNHPQVRSMVQQFPTEIRRFAPIALDIFFDHVLVQRWHDFAVGISLDELCQRFYQELQNHNLEHSCRFAQVKQSLLKHLWLQNYRHSSTCEKALYSIEQRLGNKHQFAAVSMRFYKHQQEEIAKLFQSMYPEILNKAHQMKKSMCF